MEEHLTKSRPSPVTLDIRNIGQSLPKYKTLIEALCETSHRSFPKEVESSTAVSTELTNTGFFLSRLTQRMVFLIFKCLTDRHPGLFNIFTTCLMVSAVTVAGVISIFTKGLAI